MLSFIVGVVVFVLFITIMGFAFILKGNSKKSDNVSCSGGCSACKHQ